MRKCAVLFHGDCDGVISAGLYIRRFFRDLYPGQVVLRHSHPWRLALDLKKVLLQPDIDIVVLVDLALNSDDLSLLLEAVKRRISIIIIDHHQSSEKALSELKTVSNIKIYWSTLQSTPQVLAQSVLRNLNNYEQMLVTIANVCEGGSTEDEYIRSVADKVKLVLAVEPTNNKIIYSSVDSIVKGEEFWKIQQFDEVYWKAKWLLSLLIKKIQIKAKNLCGWDIATFTLPESLIFAGLFGIASSEYMKKVKRSVILIREEEDKFVITIRSTEKKALEACDKLVNHIDSGFKGVFGGHKEAASLTIRKTCTINNLQKIVEEGLRKHLCVSS
ncbi:MAG: DHH family phosphoesterase [Ignisphaera sp.]